ncbi:TolC family protein [Desulfofundulus sp.]|uniref:TolC family protein n=1 Tax=Desulfofundulus sp. TaxID=2282750 RepID=UPI003C72E3B6
MHRIRSEFLALVLCVLLALAPAAVAFGATGPAPAGLTLQQAVDMALSNSSTLRADALAIDRAKYDRDAAGLAVSFTPTGQTTPQAEAAFTKLMQADLAWQMAKKTYDADKDTVVMKVYQAYAAVLQAAAAVDAAQQALDSADWQHRAAVAGYRVGTLSRSQMVQADASTAGAKAQLEAAKKALDDAYQKFDQLVGLPAGVRPVLSDRPAYAPLNVDSLEAEVSRAVDASPYVWLAQRNIDLARIALDIYSYGPAEAHTYKATELGVPIAEEQAASARDQMAQLVRSLYYGIRQLEENYAGLQQKVAVDEENLRVVQVKYRVGMATRVELAAAQAALAGDKRDLVNLLCQHQVLVQAFKTPWAYAGAAGSSGSTASGSGGSSSR